MILPLITIASLTTACICLYMAARRHNAGAETVAGWEIGVVIGTALGVLGIVLWIAKVKLAKGIGF